MDPWVLLYRERMCLHVLSIDRDEARAVAVAVLYDTHPATAGPGCLHAPASEIMFEDPMLRCKIYPRFKASATICLSMMLTWSNEVAGGQ